MKPSVVILSALLTALIAAPLSIGASGEERYPARPVKILVPYPAGGPGDVTARVVAAKLDAALSGNFIVENVPGAAGSLGAHAVGASAADGYTLLWMNQDFIVQPLIKKNIPYDAVKSFEPISFVATAPEAILVNPSLPVKTLPELIDLLKADPGKYSYATPGFGTTPHLAGERLFHLTYHVDVAHVPYQGAAPAIIATMAGQTQILFTTIGSVGPNLKDGSLRAIAVESAQRWPAFPNVPTLADYGLNGYEAEFIIGLMAPAGTPKAIVERLSGEVAKAVVSQDVKERFAALGLKPVGGGPGELAAKLAEATAAWAKVVKSTGIKAE